MDTYTHVKIGQVRHDIRPHFAKVHDVPAPFGVSSHCTSSVALVVVVRALLGGEREAAEGRSFEESLCWMHLEVRRGSVLRLDLMEMEARVGMR